jgi:hypothetical protein
MLMELSLSASIPLKKMPKVDKGKKKRCEKEQAHVFKNGKE